MREDSIGAGCGMRSALEELVQESRSLLQLSENWDGENSPGYSLATWQRAVTFLRREAEWSRMFTGREMPLPRILPGPDGDIDIHWIQPEYRLLISIAAAPQPAAFHLSRGSDTNIRGTFDPDAASLIRLLDQK